MHDGGRFSKGSSSRGNVSKRKQVWDALMVSIVGQQRPRFSERRKGIGNSNAYCSEDPVSRNDLEVV